MNLQSCFSTFLTGHDHEKQVTNMQLVFDGSRYPFRIIILNWLCVTHGLWFGEDWLIANWWVLHQNTIKQGISKLWLSPAAVWFSLFFNRCLWRWFHFDSLGKIWNLLIQDWMDSSITETALQIHHFYLPQGFCRCMGVCSLFYWFRFCAICCLCIHYFLINLLLLSYLLLFLLSLVLLKPQLRLHSTASDNRGSYMHNKTITFYVWPNVNLTTI